MKVKNWKSLEQHPLSSEYEDLVGPGWDAMVNGIQAHGFDSSRPILLVEHQGKLKVGDGWQRQRACVACDVRPKYRMLPKKMTLDAYIEMHNDARRHETATQRERRLAKRAARIAAARAGGQSTRSIASNEGLSQSQVRRVLEDAEEQGLETAPKDGKVIGKDGVAQAATKKHDEDDDAVVDDEHIVVPAKLRGVFSSVPAFNKAIAACQKAAAEMEALEQTDAYKVGAKEVNERRVYSTVFRSAEKMAMGAKPVKVCCGDGCAKCGRKGYFSAEDLK